ncbi:MAG: DUF2937 family protein [Rhizobiales bacterium]|nr:DUF2937 family protein [Hyphomicrobiales bacterium]
MEPADGAGLHLSRGIVIVIRTLSPAVGLLGAILAAQLPELVQQYKQRLGGAIDEMATIVARFDADAASNSLTRDQAMAALAASQDDLVRRRGEDMKINIARLQNLRDSRLELDTADPVARLGGFLRHADGDLLAATVEDFQPAVPTTAEGLICALFGFLLGWCLVRLPAWPYRRWQEMRLRRHA